jgi:predicted transcriptional regulator
MPINTTELTRRREALGITPAEAARRAGMKPQQWNSLERGWVRDPQISTLARVAAALECRVDDLIH